jgi:Asp-tRNA(Asn)/Glu-tRNA(Gln) amidotransferase A subunit family amidase
MESRAKGRLGAEPGKKHIFGRALHHKVPGAAALGRRELLKALTAIGAGSAVFGRALVALAEERGKVTEEMIRQAEWVAGMEFNDAKRKLMLEDVNKHLQAFGKLRQVSLDNSVPPALWFHPAPRLERGAGASKPARSASGPAGARRAPLIRSGRPPSAPLRAGGAGAGHRPDSPEDLAFAPVATLAALLRSKLVSSVELTRLYLGRLRRYDPALKAVITYTEELGMEQAKRADREIAAGRYRGTLHGIPWGAKDLLAVPGYRTTWGSVPYKEQVRPEKATVVARLEEAGAVLVAKLSVGELAWGDVWFGGTTKNPWNLKEGSSGSSAGSAAATAAGLVGFAIGTETLGSIVSPCTRCGVSGLRPTYGRVSRYGAMALSWSMDKIGAIARTAEDCALVFQAIHGADGKDPSAVDRPFPWPPKRNVRSLRVGYLAKLFEEDRAKNAEKEEQKPLLREWQEFDRRTLETLRGLGFQLIPIELPDRYPVSDLRFILDAEAATAFDEIPRSGKDDLMVRQTADSWPNVFREAQLIPAVGYLRANRIRTLVIEEMEKRMGEVDVYVSPSYGGGNLLLTNLTGHPCVVVPNGFHANTGTPTSITFIGRLYGETEALALAGAYQQATDFHKKRPPLEALT